MIAAVRWLIVVAVLTDGEVRVRGARLTITAPRRVRRDQGLRRRYLDAVGTTMRFRSRDRSSFSPGATNLKRT